MDTELILGIAVTTVVGVIGFFVRGKLTEVDRLTKLVNVTREEVAKQYASKTDLHNETVQIMGRLDRLETKLDRLLFTIEWDGKTDRRS